MPRHWLVILRETQGLTQKNVAEKIGITRQMIGAIETGVANPSVTTAKLLGDFLGFNWVKLYEDTTESSENAQN